MIAFLLVAIVCNAVLFVILKYFDRYGVSTLQAIVVNYFTAGTLGLIISPEAMQWSQLPQKPWYWVPPVMGMLFISIFLLLARTAQRIGISTASVANKMSVIIPVLVGVIGFGESLGIWKIAGILLALAAVWMTSKRKEAQQADAHSWWLPVIVFLGSGAIDAFVNYAQYKLFTAPGDGAFFISCCFYSALCIGIVVVAIQYVRGKETFSWKNIAGGIILGLPNYFSIWCIVEALRYNAIDSSVLYPINNMGIVILSSVAALLFFREKMSKLNWIGVLISVIAIGLMAIDKFN